MADKSSDSDQPVVIKKYANRRLYNLSTSNYVTLDHLCQMVKDDIDFVVLNAKGNDITRSVLTQIVVEEEAKGENLLPLSFLRQLIGFYGDNMQRMLLPQYLEYSINAFANNKEEIENYMRGTFGKIFPFGQLEQMGNQKAAMFERSMRMFTTFDRGNGVEQNKVAEAKPDQSETFKSLQDQLNALQAQLNKISGGG